MAETRGSRVSETAPWNNKEGNIMENKKKNYRTPQAELVEFDFKEQVVASGEASCDHHRVWDAAYPNRCWPLYTA